MHLPFPAIHVLEGELHRIACVFAIELRKPLK